VINVIVLFPPTQEPEELDTYLTERLAPTVHGAQGVVSVCVNHGPMMSSDGPAPYSRIMTASFAEMSDAVAFGTSPDTAEIRNEGNQFGQLFLMYESQEF